MSNHIKNLVVAVAVYVTFSCSQLSTVQAQGSGATWTTIGNYAPWGGVASSADGTIVYAAAYNLWASTDSGVTWTLRNSDRGWYFVACSADGTKLVANSGDYTPLYTSTDSGTTFTERTGSPLSVNSIATSADGTKLAVISQDDGYIHTSIDSGADWVQQIQGGEKGWSSIASSADGTKLVAVVRSTFPSGGGWIYTSTDSGVSWTPRDSPRTWTSVASSADGTKLVAVDGAPGQVYTSTDSGTNWTPRDSDRNWISVASSADGTKLAAAVNGGPIYTSTNSGTNWTAGQIATNPFGVTNLSRAWRQVACSADGTKLVAVENPGGGTNGFIFISGVLIVPALNIFPNSNNVAATWPYPSPGWTLQQSSNLTTGSWTPSLGVTNNGHVNYINISPKGTRFFRLQLQQ